MSLLFPRKIHKFVLSLCILALNLSACAAESPQAVVKEEKTATASDLLPEERKTIAIFKQAAPSVVFIKNASLQLDWFTSYVYEIPRGAGSGFVWDDQGHIVTNFHVVYQADRIEVVMDNQESYPANVVGVSPNHDLAVLKIDAPGHKLVSMKLGDSSNLQVGQKTIAIGNPFGLDYSLTTGVISSVGRTIRSIGGRNIHDVIQTDAAINPGNSGGPLMDSSGRVIGVSTAIYSPSGAYAGVGLAIPINIVKRVVPQLIQYGRVKRVGLGLTLVPDVIRQRLGAEGALILEVQPGSAADIAGLKGTRRNRAGDVILGDVITSIDGEEVENNTDLIDTLEPRRAGEEVGLQFRRNGKVFGSTAVLKDLDDDMS